MTHNRSNHEIQCTVCNYAYNVRKEFEWHCARDCKLFCGHTLICCGLKHEPFLLRNIGGKIGFALVIFGICVWIVSTSFVLSTPPYELPMYLYYLIAIFDLTVGIATLWFVLKCRWLTSLFLAVFYTLRCLYLLFVTFIPVLQLDTDTHFNQFTHTHSELMHRKSYYINVVSYFIVFSFIALLILTLCAVVDVHKQCLDYKIKHQTLTINGIKIDIASTVNHPIHQ